MITTKNTNYEIISRTIRINTRLRVIYYQLRIMSTQSVYQLLKELVDTINNLQKELIREQHRKSRIRSGGYRKKHNLASSIGRDDK